MEVANVELLLAWFTDPVEAIHFKKSLSLFLFFVFISNNVANYLRTVHSIIEAR